MVRSHDNSKPAAVNNSSHINEGKPCRVEGSTVHFFDGRSYVLPYPVAEAIDCPKWFIVRLEVPADVVDNENVWALVKWRASPFWRVPARHHAKERSPYVRIELRDHLVVCFGEDGHVLELTMNGGHVANEYDVPPGPRYVIDGGTIAFPNGKRAHLGWPIQQTLDFGPIIVVLLSFENAPFDENLFGITRDGDIAWQIAPSKFPPGWGVYSAIHRAGDRLVANGGGDRAYTIDPLTGTIIDSAWTK
jgi:hypothetical protein